MSAKFPRGGGSRTFFSLKSIGFVSPITLRAKTIVQHLCRKKLGWDDEIPQVHQAEWQTWLGTLPHLQNISVNRCFKPQGFGDIHNAQLHFLVMGQNLDTEHLHI